MVTRLVLRMPWFASLPTLVLMAVFAAVATNLIGGKYFERVFVNDIDPLAGVTLPAPLTAPGSAVSTVTTGGAALSGGGMAPVVAGTAASGTATTATGGAVQTGVRAAAALAPVAATAPLTAASAPAPAPAPAPTGPVLLSQGSFVDGDPGHHGKGAARLIRAADGQVVLRFENFSVTNGPDLFVILSTDPAGSRGSAAAGDAVNLGKLKATDGNVNYTVSPGTDVSGYRSVIIYCRAFKVVFAVATLG